MSGTEIKVNKEELRDLLAIAIEALTDHVNDEDIEEETREALALKELMDYQCTMEAEPVQLIYRATIFNTVEGLSVICDIFEGTFSGLTTYVSDYINACKSFTKVEIITIQPEY